MKRYEVREDVIRVSRTLLVDLDIVFYNILQERIEIFLEVDLLSEIQKDHTHLNKIRKIMKIISNDIKLHEI